MIDPLEASPLVIFRAGADHAGAGSMTNERMHDAEPARFQQRTRLCLCTLGDRAAPAIHLRTKKWRGRAPLADGLRIHALNADGERTHLFERVLDGIESS